MSFIYIYLSVVAAEYLRLAEIARQRQWQGATFLMNIRDNCNTSQKALDTITHGVVSLTKAHTLTNLVKNRYLLINKLKKKVLVHILFFNFCIYLLNNYILVYINI